MQASEKPDAGVRRLEPVLEEHADEQADPGESFKPGGDGENFSDLQSW